MKILVAFVIAASFVAPTTEQDAEQVPQPIVVVTASVGIN